jgi:acetolactate synthase-1/2/3 large subunit
MDLVKLAEAMDCEGVQATDIASLEAAVSDLGSVRRPRIVEAIVDPSQYQAQF